MKDTETLLNEALKRSAKMRALVRFDHKAGTIDIYSEEGSQPYSIEFRRINTHQKLVRWIYQLIQKSWITNDHIHMLLVVWDAQLTSGEQSHLIGPL
jgi:hypothetical protein